MILSVHGFQIVLHKCRNKCKRRFQPLYFKMFINWYILAQKVSLHQENNCQTEKKIILYKSVCLTMLRWSVSLDLISYLWKKRMWNNKFLDIWLTLGHIRKAALHLQGFGLQQKIVDREHVALRIPRWLVCV